MAFRATKYFCVSFAFVAALLFLAPSARAATLVSGSVSGAWTSSGSPYVVTGSLYVAPGSTLSVGPGAVVKFFFGTGITVDGTLQVDATASEKAVFTSVKDDLVDGQDSSNDGPTIGAPGDWNSIQFNAGSTGAVSEAVIRYGGWTCFSCSFANVANKGGVVMVAGSRISKSADYGIRQFDVASASTAVSASELDGQEDGFRFDGGGPASVSGSNLHDNVYGVFADNAAAADLTLTDDVFADNATAPARIGAPVNFTHSGNAASGGFRSGFIMSGAVPAGATRTWDADLPYVIGTISVPPGSTLVIGPGAVVKPEFGGGISVDGTLQVNGTAQAKAYVTSVKDDQAADDTNGDGFSTLPAPQDWNGIVFNPGSTGAISNAIIRYGGWTCYTCKWADVTNNGGAVTFADSVISYAGYYGVRQTNVSASTTIHGSSLIQNAQYAAYNDTTTYIDATGNWWGDSSGPTHWSNSGGTGARVSDYVDFGSYLHDDSTLAPTIAHLSQYETAGGPALAEGAATNGNHVIFRAAVSSPTGAQVMLEVELKPVAAAFDGTSLLISPPASSGMSASVDSDALVDGDYHWRARAVDLSGHSSPWVEFGVEGNVDFAVDAHTIIRVAVILADLTGDPSTTADNVVHADPATLTQPCKLLDPDEIYALGHPDPVTGSDGWKKYYENLFYCVNGYYGENSYGTVRYDFTVFDNGGAWFDAGGIAADGTTKKTEAYYAKDDQSLYALVQDSKYLAGNIGPAVDIVAVVHARTSRQRTHGDGQIGTAASVRPDGTQDIVLAEDDPVGVWAHEFGHELGVTGPGGSLTPDLYDRGMVDGWDLMADGEWNGDQHDAAHTNAGMDPPHMSTFSKLFIGWFGQDIHAKSAYGDQYWINSLETSGVGASAFRYNLEDNVDPATSRYYLLEARNKTLATWDASLPTSAASDLVLYYVNSGGGTVTVPAAHLCFADGSMHGGVLDPSRQESFCDYDQLVKFTALDDRSGVGSYEIRAGIQAIPATTFNRIVRGVVVRTNDLLRSKLPASATAVQAAPLVDWTKGQTTTVEPLIGRFPQDYVRGILQLLDPASTALVLVFMVLLAVLGKKHGPAKQQSPAKKRVVLIALGITTAVFVALTVIGHVTVFALERWERTHDIHRLRYTWPLHQAYAAPLGLAADQPDVDLHVYCDDGRHVGTNYATGEYENQITGALASGDQAGAPEWIYLPEGAENCHYVVSARDNARFLAENPDVASHLADTSDSYDVYARYIDPASGIFTSTTLANQVIQPGAEVVHEVSGTADVAIGAGVADTAAPTTAAALSGTLGADGATYVSPVTVTLSADDGADGTGSSGIRYSPDGGLTWLDYSAPFTLSDDGASTVFFGSTDHAGNVEDTKNIVVKIDRTLPDTVIDSAPSGSTGSTSAAFAFHSTEDDSTFACSLDAAEDAPCTSPATYASIAVGPHVFEVRATDPAGNVDATPASASWTVLATGTINATFDRHTVQAGTQPGSTKSPIAGATVNAYATAAGSCAAAIGMNPHDYATVLSTCTPDASAIADASGLASLNVLPGDYLVLSRDPQTDVVAGVSSGTIVAADAVDKFLQVIVRANGTSVPGKTTVRTGSLLYIIEPEYVEWSQIQELYPFVFDAPSGDWGITVTVTPPEGFTADYPDLSTDVNGDYKALQFTLTDVGSCWECGTGVDLTIRHKGRTEHLHQNIPTPMTEAFVKKKGLDLKELEERGVRVTVK